jgi:hypothetical protein
VFPLQNSVLKPDALYSSAVVHSVFAEQFPGVVPLSAQAVKLAVLIRLFGSKHSVLVPGAGSPVPSTIPQWHFFADLAVPIKVSLGDGPHFMRLPFWQPHRSRFSQNRWLRKGKSELFTAFKDHER